MRILTTASILLFATALASQASACDRHGGMFGQLGGAAWTTYNSSQSSDHDFLMQDSLSQWIEKNNAQPAEVQPKKPSFSKVSTRASMAAQTRLALKAKRKKQEDEKAKAPATSETPSEMAPR